MLKVTTAKEMQDIDRIAIEKYGISGALLMERAGRAVAEKINELFFQKSEVNQLINNDILRTTIIILCGGGNNGGDGLVIARLLHNQGRDVKVFLASRPAELKGDAKVNYNSAIKFRVKIYPINKFLTSRFTPLTSRFFIVDALLGAGLSNEVRAPLSDVIKKINRMSSPVVSVDIPSGISSDTGQIMGSAVKAHHTVTFGLPKRGHLLYPGAEYTGNLHIAEIGFPRNLLESKKIRVNLVQKRDVISLMPERPAYSHKGSYGHVLLVAGSRGKTGAALMAAKACLRTGAGLVTIGIPETLINAFQSRVTEEMILPLPDKGDGTLALKAADTILEFIKKRANVLAIGPGLSVDKEITKLVCLLISKSRVPVVIDADGINAIAGKTGLLKKSMSPVILTPHSGEMARLLSHGAEVKSSEIERDRISAAVSFARRTNTYLVLKGVPTVTATPDGNAFINSTGNPGMAKAGTGDVLTGMISALLAQGLTPRDASVLGVYMHGHIGDIMAEKKGKQSLIASDIINAIPSVFKSILRDKY
jgi:ADP-dependent NAD(P)H-hydrate dehydratase / NAD(P)H-hydrate epimerase